MKYIMINLLLTFHWRFIRKNGKAREPMRRFVGGVAQILATALIKMHHNKDLVDLVPLTPKCDTVGTLACVCGRFDA
ncbi:hypothetical protein Syun_007197 [Stephania yunnanensis]|uniref:Uncharacterized protein n=1 Tax=Stephania yunnanensis TaxID=152371 RepID=A0AAP0Q262_9MAGN